MSKVQLIIVRGLPGSGKSTIAKNVVTHVTSVGDTCVHFETDMFFTDETGEYKYDVSKIVRAHEWCQQSVFSALAAGKSVVVSNTFVKKWEVQPYLDFCREKGITTSIVVASGNYKNVHNVPENVIARMKSNWEDF